MAQGYNLNPIQGDLYSAGNVQFDPTPYVRYSLEVQARNRARDDAFARAFQDLGARVTPAGMDGLDIDNFMKRKKEWQDYVIKNEKAYKNPALDDGQVYGEAMRRYNNILSVQQNSLDKLERLKPLRAIYADPTKRALLTEQTIMDAQRGMLPVNHPDYKPFNPNSINYNPEPFSQASVNSYLDQVKQQVTGEKVYGNTRIDKATKERISPYTIKINEKDYPIIRNLAIQLSGSDPSAARFFDQELNNPQDYARHNEIYKRTFGKDIETREDMATAWTLGMLDLESRGEEKSTYSPPSGGSSLLGLRELLKDQKDERDFQTLVNFYNSKKVNGQRSVKEIGFGSGNYKNGIVLNLTPAELAKFGKGITKVVEYEDGTIEAYQMPRDKSKPPIKTFPITQADVLNVLGDELNLGTRMSGAMGYATEQVQQQQPQTAQPQPPAKKTISRKDIPSKAAAAGYTTKEYEELLKKNGVKITE